MIIENKEMGIRFEVDNQQDFDKWYAIRKEQIRSDVIDKAFNALLMMVKDGYDYPNEEFKNMFIALVEDAIDSIKKI